MNSINDSIVRKYDADSMQKALNFNSGNYFLDSFIKTDDSLNPWYGVTYIWTLDNKMLGYFTLSAGSIEDYDTNEKIAGAVHINNFALDLSLQKKTTKKGINYSDILLNLCFDVINDLRNEIGFSFVTLCSTEEGYNLYDRKGFSKLETDFSFSFNQDTEIKCYKMYLALDDE